MNIRKPLSVLFVAALCTLSLGFINTNRVIADAEGMNVQYHSRGAVRCYMLQHGYGRSPEISYARTPVTTSPYDIGQISSESEAQALEDLNMMRYIAGLDHNVTINPDYRDLAQAACLINCVNGGLNHQPSRPDGMSDELYSMCRTGAGSCNLGSGYGLNNSVYGWMVDSGVSSLGHRRWIINPSMGAVGFGQVGYVTAMYCFDRSNSAAFNTRGVAWPAQNMPTQFFSSNQIWSFSVGSSVNSSNIHVTLTDNSTGRVWNFSSSSADGYFNVDNGGYGQSGCIMFRPNDIDVSHDKSFSVSITGAGSNISYTVNFFDIYSISDLEDDYNIDYSHEGCPMFRCYNPNSGEHFYTSNFLEVTNIVNVGWSYEGVGWYAPASSNTPVYRLYNPYGGEHHYTTDIGERDALTSLGWNYEGVGWYSDDARRIPLYRQYNPNAFANNHNYTTSLGENDWLVSLGWQAEGIGWYGV